MGFQNASRFEKMRKRDRECFESNTATYMFPDVAKKPTDAARPWNSLGANAFADDARPDLCATALALVQNPQRLAAYVKQLSHEFVMLFINDTIPSTAMTNMLKSNNYFWYLLWQRVAREAPFHGQIEYKNLAKR